MATSTLQNSPALTLIARIFLSLLFIPAGWSKLTSLSGTAQYFGSIGLPMPTITALIVGLLELVAGVAILLGFQTRIAAIVLALFTIGTAIIGHMSPFDQTSFLKNLAIAGGFLILAQHGAGSLSIDGKRG